MATYTPRRVKDEDERGSYSSEYISLDTGEKFIGYALFTGDPKAAEPGYFEYWEHYDPGLGKRGQSVPCVEEGCPYCDEGEKPRYRAKTAWLVEQVGDRKLPRPELRTFTMSPQIIRQLSEFRNEGEKILGRNFRISRPEERQYVVAPKTEVLKATEVKEALKGVPDFAKGLATTLTRAMERLLMEKALNQEEPDVPPTPRREQPTEPEPAPAPPPPPPSRSKGKAQPIDPEVEEAVEPMPWPEILVDAVIVTAVDPGGNFFEAQSGDYDGAKNVYTTEGIELDFTDLVKGQIVGVQAALDGDGDYVVTAEPQTTPPPAPDEEEDEDEPEEETAAAANELPNKIEGETFVVKSVDTGNQTMDVENDDLGLAFELFFLQDGPGSDVDMDDYAAGDKVTVFADKDAEGDMVAIAVPQKVTPRRRSSKASTNSATRAKGK